jgi:catechol 2,3-dioxygenase-like lactoylglutathione lyase family enzyme
MIKTFGLTHVALAVRDVDRSAKFYRQVFGAVQVYRQDGFAQLQTPGSHDVIVLEKKSRSVGKSGGIAHFGFRLQHPKDIRAAPLPLARAGGTVKDQGEFRARRTVPVRHRSGWLRDRDLVRAADASGSPGSAGTLATARGI